MAKMIPQVDLGTLRLRGEEKLYRALRDDLPDDFRVFHRQELRTVEDDTFREREFDFLIVHPELGFLDVEVKGGDSIIYRPKQKAWFQVSADSSEHQMKKSPFTQASDNIHGFVREVEKRAIFPEARFPFTYGYAVAFPDATPKTSHWPADVNKELVLDAADLGESLAPRIKAIMEGWRGKRGHRLMTDQDYNDILSKFLMPEFRLARSIGMRLAEDEVDLVQLTEDQYSVLRTTRKMKRALFEGYAGTGKTQLAMEKARSLAEAGLDVVFLCYNRALAHYLVTKAPELPNLIIDNYHNFARTIIEAAALPWPADGTVSREFWTDGVPSLLAEATAKTARRFDAFIIDEGQDFRKKWFDTITALLKNPQAGYLYIFFDPRQNIYEGGLQFPIKSDPLLLDENCRNTRNICSCVTQLGEIDPEEYRNDRNPTGEKVYWEPYRDSAEQPAMIEKILRSLKAKDIKPEQVVVLSPHTREKSCLNGFQELAGCPLLDWMPVAAEGTVRFSTSKGFKGLESDVVILCDMDGKFPIHTPADRYVATSRAKHLLYVLHSADWTPPAAE